MHWIVAACATRQHVGCNGALFPRAAAMTSAACRSGEVRQRCAVQGIRGSVQSQTCIGAHQIRHVAHPCSGAHARSHYAAAESHTCAAQDAWRTSSSAPACCCSHHGHAPRKTRSATLDPGHALFCASARPHHACRLTRRHTCSRSKEFTKKQLSFCNGKQPEETARNCGLGLPLAGIRVLTQGLCTCGHRECSAAVAVCAATPIGSAQSAARCSDAIHTVRCAPRVISRQSAASARPRHS